MGRKRKIEPKLEQRTPNSCYTFRQCIKGKLQSISTKTTNYDEAKKFRRSFMAGEATAETLLMQGENAPKVAQVLIKKFIPQGLDRLNFPQAWDFWLQHNPDFKDNSERYRRQMKLYFNRFSEWCQAQSITYIDEVDASKSICYGGSLKEKNMTPATFNENRKLLSRVFACINAFKHLPHGNVFDPNIVKPQSRPPASEATHQPLEPDMMNAVIAAAAEAGQDWLDLFIVGAQTGMRLKDAALFRWEFIEGDVIEFQPEKTIRFGSIARLPVSPMLMMLLERRRKQNQPSPYVNPQIANFYLSSDWVSNKSKEIFETALGKTATHLSKVGKQRQRNGCIYSFHSFRVTLMSLLAAKQTPIRDAMTIFGWESMEMVKLYTKMLEKARGDRDRRNKELFDAMSELQFSVPEIETVPERLKPTQKALQMLIVKYSNRAIGLIYDISDVAVKNWMTKFGLSRNKRLLSPDLTEEEILNIRKELQAA